MDTPATPAASDASQRLSALAAAFADLLEPIRFAGWAVLLVQMAELHREQYHPHRLDYQRIQLEEMRQQRRRQTLRTFIPKSRRRPGARMTPGTWIPVPVPSPANRVDVHYAWVTNGVLRIQDVSVTTDTTLPGTEVRVRHVLDDLPGMWERADFEGGETDV